MIHAGIYYPAGSLKSRLCAAGARELYEFCDSRGIPADRCGKVIVATRDAELPVLDELERRGRAAGVPGLRRIGPEELAEVEPHSRGVAALHSPFTGIVDFARVAQALADEVRAEGGTVATACPVLDAEASSRAIQLTHPAGRTAAARAVFCVGPWADRLAVAMSAPADPRVVPFRGTYFRLRPARSHLVRALIYPVPDPRLPFLGVHLTRHGDGQVTVGPTALLAATRDVTSRGPRIADLRSTLTWPGTWRLAVRHWRAGVTEIARALSRRTVAAAAGRYVPEIAASDLLPGFSGIRAQALGRDGSLIDDFVLSETGPAVHVRNAPSPAATAALALARLIADRLERR